jgi:Arc/MetJ-type ribon-helix-helix transcriptional regulator
MVTMAIATKFPEADVKRMDKLVDAGEFISRSDVIREATRRLIATQKEQTKDKDDYILAMEKEGDFKNPELHALVNIMLGNTLSFVEERAAKKLLRHPCRPVRMTKKGFVLTDIGKDIAEGFLDALLHLGTIKNA